MQQFSFQQEPMEYLLQHCFAVIPGMQKALAAYYSPTHNKTNIVQSVKMIDHCHVESINDPELAGEINHWRQKKNLFSWHNSEDILLQKKENTLTQLNVFSELNNNTLLLSFSNKYDHKNDILILFLPPGSNVLGMSKENTPCPLLIKI